MKIGFYSCMSGIPWGGSEELWWRAAQILQRDRHQIAVNYKWWPQPASQLLTLQELGGEIWFREMPQSYWQRKMGAWRGRLLGNHSQVSWLKSTCPDLVLVTLGYHPDRVPIADECLELGIPYAINVQCASSFFFIHSDTLEKYRRWYQGAAKVFFVSEENRQKLENNLALRLTNAEIVANPFNVSQAAAPPWPEESVYKVACVGRIHFQSKGQDLVVDVMKQPKWRQRPIRITFYGHDQGQLRQLQDLISMNDLGQQLVLGGFEENVEGIWEQNHALLLPSRYEGAALVVIESMLCNRIGIVTDTGRNRELIDDGETGFVADGAIVKLIDQALERAWDKRDQWRAMGQLAGQKIRQCYPCDPIREFADRIMALVTTR